MTSQAPQDLDLSRLLGTLRRALPLVVLLAVALAALTYLYSRSQPKVYQATASVAALPSGNSNNLISTTLVTAPPVPPAVVDGALHSAAVVHNALLTLIPQLSAAQLKDLRARVTADGAQAVTLTSNVDQDQVGLYGVTAQAGSPAEARDIANAFMNALLTWDRTRALQNVQRAQLNLQSQLSVLDSRLKNAADDVERRSLISARGNVLQNIQNLQVLNLSVTGTLSVLSQAMTPTAPSAPQPLRNALIVLGAALFFGIVIAYLLDGLRRRVRQLRDLDHLALPIVGSLPAIARLSRSPADLPGRLRHSVFGEQMNFVRVALENSQQLRIRPAIVAVSSAQSGEGKSTVVAGLASSLAASGQRVLIFDADVFRPRQQAIWQSKKEIQSGQFNPGIVGLWDTGQENLSLAVPTAKQLDSVAFSALVPQLSAGYDFVLVDTPPMLSVAETLALAARADGLLMVVGSDTLLTSVERALQDAARLGVRPLGIVMNRSDESKNPRQYYTYSLPETAN